jgi:hypothetical protein
MRSYLVSKSVFAHANLRGIIERDVMPLHSHRLGSTLLATEEVKQFLTTPSDAGIRGRAVESILCEAVRR